MKNQPTRPPEFQIGEVVQAIDWRGTRHPWGRVVSQHWLVKGARIQTMAHDKQGTMTRSSWVYKLSNTPPKGFWLERCLHRRPPPPEPSTESWEEIRNRLKSTPKPLTQEST